MSLQRAFEIGSAGLSAQRTRMETIASNLANARATRSPEGGPYRRLAPVFVSESMETAPGDPQANALRSVRVDRIIAIDEDPILRFEPGHPDADAEGMVAYPNINPVTEMIDMLSASRSYEANVNVITGVREMMAGALDIIG